MQFVKVIASAMLLFVAAPNIVFAAQPEPSQGCRAVGTFAATVAGVYVTRYVTGARTLAGLTENAFSIGMGAVANQLGSESMSLACENAVEAYMDGLEQDFNNYGGGQRPSEFNLVSDGLGLGCDMVMDPFCDDPIPDFLEMPTSGGWTVGGLASAYYWRIEYPAQTRPPGNDFPTDLY